MENPLSALTLDQLRQRTSMKWRRYPADVLPLWVAEMDVHLAEPVSRALRDAIALGDTGYPAGTVYAEAVAAFADERWGWAVDIGRTAIVPDVMLGIVEVLKLVTGPGDAVVINSPVYTPFYQFVSHMDRRVVESPLTMEHRIDFDSLGEVFEQVTAGGGRAAYLLCSPHNPTGTVHTRDELTGVAGLAAQHRVRVVADEIHAPLVSREKTHVPYLSLNGSGDAFALLSASKGWNLAGLKAALAVAGSDASKDLGQLPEEVSHGPSHLGILAHSAALTAGGDWLDALLAGLDENRQLLNDLLSKHLPEVTYRQSAGTYFAWLDCRRLGLGNDPADVFLQRGRVALNSGPAFGTGGAGHVRLNLATSPDILTTAVERMVTSLS
ncbi:MAG: pyridoxal phosphate-dependent aminotransferase [Nocardioidaceae bacterium]|nr:pyridoxal phosphate-dependent aminotransferase [Nocardioidaceae bacterium]